MKCEYNKDGDSFRSPFSNKYYPPLPEDVEDAFYPTGQLRSLEEKMNSILFDYLKLYFENNGLGSAYFFETDDSGFGACVGIKNSYEDLSQGVISATWDSSHVFTVLNEGKYSLVSTIFLQMELSGEAHGEIKIAGSCSRMIEATHAPASKDSEHIS